MAGSYKHVVTDQGNLCSPDSWFIENLGDTYEAVEEMYGMIWFLADTVVKFGGQTSVDLVELARQNYDEGLRLARETSNKRSSDGS